SGEDIVLRCSTCGYAANAEKAEIGGWSQESVEKAVATVRDRGGVSEVVSTPGAHTVAEVCDFLKVGPNQIIKTIIVKAGAEVVAALVRGDRDLSLTKLDSVVGAPCEMADAATVQRATGAPVGFAGPIGLKGIRIFADPELAGATD